MDFISWMWTVDGDKSRMFMFVLVFDGCSAILYGLLASGRSPVFFDSLGRLLIVVRYLHRLFTESTTLYAYCLVCSVSWKELLVTM